VATSVDILSIYARTENSEYIQSSEIDGRRSGLQKK
jgi:hypothetical protein